MELMSALREPFNIHVTPARARLEHPRGVKHNQPKKKKKQSQRWEIGLLPWQQCCKFRREDRRVLSDTSGEGQLERGANMTTDGHKGGAGGLR